MVPFTLKKSKTITKNKSKENITKEMHLGKAAKQIAVSFSCRTPINSLRLRQSSKFKKYYCFKFF